jgi:two-component system response regulator RegX3
MVRTADPARLVLVVEDEESISEPLAAALRRARYDVRIAGSVRDALLQFETQRPDVVLLDVMLPDGDGRDVLRQVGPSGVPVVMLTARSDQIDKVVGLELGADDYVTKPFDPAELLARVRAVLRRVAPHGDTDQPTEHGVLRVRDVEMDLDARTVTRAGVPIDLAFKEFELLRILFEHPGRVVRRGTLMDELWGPDWYGSDKKLDVHMSTLRRKLGEDPAHPRLIHTVRGVGFRAATSEDNEGNDE